MHVLEKMGNKPQNEIRCFKHKVDLRNIVDVPLDNVVIKITGVDEYGNTWISITCESPAVLEGIKETFEAELDRIAQIKCFNNPIGRILNGNVLHVRIAKAGDSKLHFGVYSARGLEAADVWKKPKADDELRELLSSGNPVGVDLSMAGAFTFEEGTCVSIVCRRVYRVPHCSAAPEEVKEDFEVVKSEDALSIV